MLETKFLKNLVSNAKSIYLNDYCTTYLKEVYLMNSLRNFTKIAFLAISILVYPNAWGADATPELSITANGQSTPLTITPEERLVVKAQISGVADPKVGDWWILASTSFGLFRFDIVNGANDQWGTGISISRRPLTNTQLPLVPSSITIESATSLQVGTYHMHIILDREPDNVLNSIFDYKQVNITVVPKKLRQFEFLYDFERGLDGWQGDFADLPANHDIALYELSFTHEPLPTTLGEGKAAVLQSHNRSDDVFMFLKRKVSGLKLNTVYNVSFDIRIASNAMAGAIGIGGAPGESVYLKAGVTLVKPTVEDKGSRMQINIDIGNQASGGQDMIVLGNIAIADVAVPNSEYQFKTLNNNSKPFQITTSKSDSVWIIMGTDSGFEGFTKLYYDEIKVVFEEQSVVPEISANP